jgi:hypothetical protein
VIVHRKALFWIGCALAICWHSEATARDPKPIPDNLDTHPDLPTSRPYSAHWTGAYLGVEALSGPLWLTTRGLSDEPGWLVGARLRANHVMSLLDASLEYRVAFHNTTADAVPVSITHHGVSLGFGLHPLFLLNLGNDWLSYALASMYLQGGLSLDFLSVALQDHPAASEAALGYFVGGGLDLPLSPTDAPVSVWMGLSYRHHRVEVAAAPFNTRMMTSHGLLLSLSLRSPGLGW